eukprot:TRINITY_DN2488_c0_g1_i1.p1 TRINITY_DN2488_c0_g1~~TRINITY_DN2488_c0_g1_i1.p1  ORF type:complete len:185 (-),score=3.87 TRINITY_DN2488_c0_g1_i1:94-648(-)
MPASGDEFKEKFLTVNQTNAWHAEQVQWLKKKINEHTEHKRQVVVLTHHAPSSFQCLWPNARDERQKYMQFDDLEDSLMGGSVKLWCFGHTHWSSDYIRNGTRVVSNQMGYIMLKVDGITGSNRFEPEKVLSLKDTQRYIDHWWQYAEDPLLKQERDLKEPQTPQGWLSFISTTVSTYFQTEEK